MIYYVAFYNPKEEIGKRIANYAGEDKIDYICEVLNKNGEDVTVLSNTKSVDSKFQGRKLYNISDKKKVMMFSSISNINKLIHAIDVVWGYLQLSGYLIKNLRKDDTVIVYHSLGYRRLFNVISKIRKFNYILEVEELFQYIDSANAFKKKESTVFSSPNAFIFSNAIIEQAVNKENKPYVVVNGIYKNEKIITQKPNINKIRVLYAGNLDRQKGVDYVIQTAKYLSDSFELKIIGFGSDADIDRVNNLILESNNNSKCKVYFDGVFKGDEYISIVQQCDIGVCIQEPNDKFNLYEFPQKYSHTCLMV